MCPNTMLSEPILADVGSSGSHYRYHPFCELILNLARSNERKLLPRSANTDNKNENKNNSRQQEPRRTNYNFCRASAEGTKSYCCATEHLGASSVPFAHSTGSIQFERLPSETQVRILPLMSIQSSFFFSLLSSLFWTFPSCHSICLMLLIEKNPLIRIGNSIQSGICILETG